MIRKLVIYRDDETRHRLSGSYSCLVTFDAVRQRGEFDDGCGNFGHVDFAVVGSNADIAELPRKHRYDVIELVGFDIPGKLLEE